MPGVTIYNEKKAYKGYTLFCETFAEPVWRPGKEAVIQLIDMNGAPAHTWKQSKTTLQSHCRLLPNGHVIYPTHDRSDVASGNVGLFELDRDSRVVWSYRCRVDHDFQVLENGNILVHTINETMWPALGPELKRHPYMIEVARDKQLVWEWRGEQRLDELKALLPAEGWKHLMDRATGRFAFDWAHNNTLQVIRPNAAYEKEKAAGGPIRFKPGNIFFSYRSVDVIGVIERETGRIVWAWGPGVIDGQHKPHMLANGNVLIFDNGTLRGYSRVIELNPLTERIEWEYDGRPDHEFLSKAISSAQRLPNGNTLICDGNNARLFEVTPDKEIVWEFRSPHTCEWSKEFIYRCLRYSPDYVKPLLG
ncbi:MAG: aryl-sulfate sulfotransferase [Candidatus Sumerlaeota bacterium]|nr:aryl-sulfate sulfotransferase [Candidatus Sumerlaeota bacterium]